VVRCLRSYWDRRADAGCCVLHLAPAQGRPQKSEGPTPRCTDITTVIFPRIIKTANEASLLYISPRPATWNFFCYPIYKTAARYHFEFYNDINKQADRRTQDINKGVLCICGNWVTRQRQLIAYFGVGNGSEARSGSYPVCTGAIFWGKASGARSSPPPSSEIKNAWSYIYIYIYIYIYVPPYVFMAWCWLLGTTSPSPILNMC
jgi:hypothetical protein